MTTTLTIAQAASLQAQHPVSGPVLPCRRLNVYMVSNGYHHFPACATCGQNLQQGPTHFRHQSTPPALVAARLANTTQG